MAVLPGSKCHFTPGTAMEGDRCTDRRVQDRDLYAAGHLATVTGNVMHPAQQLRSRLLSLVPSMAVVTCLVGTALTSATAADPADASKAPAEPWSESFTMVLQNRDRTFVTRGANTYMVMEAKDLAKPNFLNGKEVLLLGKFEHTDGQRAYFFGLDRFAAVGDLTLWATRLEGDNLYVFGDIRVTRDSVELHAREIITARSDAQLVAQRLAEVKPDDYAGRLQLAAWARGQAEVQGNRDWWELAAATIVAETINVAMTVANEQQDATILGQAFGWAINDIQDVGLAARVASQPWFHDQPEAVAAGKRLAAMGYDRYKDVWRPRAESLTLQFEDTFLATAWRDAEGFYKLGRWVDRHAEDLPRAKDLSFRAYQAGYRADANHAGIRRELGLGAGSAEDARRGGRNTVPTGPFQDITTGVVVGGPEGWQRNRPLDSDARWADLSSDTSYITLNVLGPDQVTGDFQQTWQKITLPWQVRSGFVEEGTESVIASTGQAQRLRFRFQEGSDLRGADLVMVFDENQSIALVLMASYLEQDRDRAQAALLETLAKISMPGPGQAREPDAQDEALEAP